MIEILNAFQQVDFPVGILMFKKNTTGEWLCVEANKSAEAFLAHPHLISKKWGDIFSNSSITLEAKNDIFQVNDSTWLLINIVENKDKQQLIITLSNVTEPQSKIVTYEKMVEKLKNSNKNLEHFAYVASHDLREPLRKIIAFSERLNKKYAPTLEGDGLFYLNRMIESTHRMQTFIDDLLMFSSFSRDTSEKINIDLNEILRGVLSDFETHIENTKAVINTQKLPTVTGVKTQMMQLFQNLISNAIKFRHSDTAPNISIDTSETDDAYQITVKDDGIGFDEGDCDNIFVLFQRLNGRSQYEGTGIGLAICKKIMDNHGGTISAKGIPNIGATFTLTLPKKTLKT